MPIAAKDATKTDAGATLADGGALLAHLGQLGERLGQRSLAAEADHLVDHLAVEHGVQGGDAADAELGAGRFAEPGVDTLSDEDVKPFAGLAALRDKLGKDDA